MELGEIYHLLFETYEGIGIMVGAGIVISLIACVLWEARTRKIYRNHEPEPEEDEWSIFEEEVEEGELEAESEAKAKKSVKAKARD